MPKVILRQPTYEGYVDYFKECNKKSISSQSEIIYDDRKDKKVIYLTFDDGPNLYYDDIMDILKKYNIKATFFITNCWNDKAIRRMKEEGHVIAIYTATHEMENIYKDEISYLYDLYTVQKYIYDIIGEYPHYIRFPGGSNNMVSLSVNDGIMKKLTKLVQELGFEYYDWNISTGDSTIVTTKEQIVSYVQQGLFRNGKDNVILMHDLHPQTIEALPEVIEYAKEQGYTFDVINDSMEPVHFIIR